MFLLRGKTIDAYENRRKNMKKGKIVATREVTSKLDGQYFEYYFYDLDTTTNYAIAFATVFDGFSYDSVHGNAVIYH